MMKKINIRTIIASVLILLVSSFVSASSVSALSAEGESLLSNLAGGGLFTGIDVNINKTTSAPVYSEGAEADLAEFLKEINFNYYDEFKIIDLTDYVINRNGTFENWIRLNYGTDVRVPASVKLMSSSDLVIFLMSNKMNPDYTVATTTGYVFDSGEEETSAVSEKEYESFDESIDYEDASDETAEDTSEDTSGNDNIPDLRKGDVNFDGFVTAGDARLALRASARLITLDSRQYYVADVTNDGFVTAKDARLILRYSAKLITHF